MPLAWHNTKFGHREDVCADKPSGDRWVIRWSKWGGDGVCYFLKFNAAQVTVTDTLDEAKAKAEELDASGFHIWRIAPL